MAKYLVMVQGTQVDYEALRGKASPGSPAWNEQELQAMYAYMTALNEDLSGTGEFVDGQGLAEPAKTRTVTRGEDGGAMVADGPYGDTETLMAGYWVLECASLERVTEIAERITRCPQPEGAPDHPVVIRPIADGADDLC